MAGGGPGEKPPLPPAGLPAAAPDGGDSSLLGAGGRSGSQTGIREAVVVAAEPTGRRAQQRGQPSTAALHAVAALVVDLDSSSAPVPARQPSTEAAPTASELLDPKSKDKERQVDTRPDSEDALVGTSLLGGGSAASVLAQACRSDSGPGMSESETGVRGLAAAPTLARLLPFQFHLARGFRYEWEEPVPADGVVFLPRRGFRYVPETLPGSSADPLFTQTQMMPRGDVGVIGDRRPARGAADALGADYAGLTTTTAMVPRPLGSQLERALQPQPHGAVVVSGPDMLPRLRFPTLYHYQPAGRKVFMQPDRDRGLALASQHGRHSRAPSPANFVMISRADVDRGWAALQEAVIERDILMRQNQDLATALQEAASRAQGLQQQCQMLRQELQLHQTERGSGGVAGQHECRDCFSRPAEVVLLPCLHQSLCHRCYIERLTCPSCGTGFILQ